MWILEADYRIECFDAEWTLYMLYAAGMVLLYPVGIPLFFYASLYKHREALHIDLEAAQEQCTEAHTRLEQCASMMTGLQPETPELLHQIKSAQADVLCTS